MRAFGQSPRRSVSSRRSVRAFQLCCSSIPFKSMATCSKIDSRGLTAQSFLRDYIDARTPLPALVSLPDALAVDSSEILKTMRTEAGERFVEVECGSFAGSLALALIITQVRKV